MLRSETSNRRRMRHRRRATPDARGWPAPPLHAAPSPDVLCAGSLKLDCEVVPPADLAHEISCTMFGRDHQNAVLPPSLPPIGNTLFIAARDPDLRRAGP